MAVWLRMLAWHIGGGMSVAFLLNGLRFLYLWGHDEHPSLHLATTCLAGVIIGGVYHISALFLQRHPVKAARLQRLLPWDQVASRFKKARASISPIYIVIALAYGGYYLTKGLESGQPWATWINTNIFHFVLFGRTYGAADILPFDVLGYALLIVASWLFSHRCPPMLARTKRPDLGDPEATPFEFAQTIQKVGADIPTRDFFLTLKGLLGRNASVIESLPAPEKKRIDERIRDMERTVDTDNRQSFVGYAIEFAQLLPQKIGKDIYAQGRNLFNITRWRSRFTIILLCILSALFAGLPVLYHLVWMVFPNIERAI